MKEILSVLLTKRPRNVVVDSGLSFLSKIYGFGNWVDRKRRLEFGKKIKFDSPTISVGNATWGGNGKTSCVEYIASFYKQIGFNPLLISNGYGSDESVQLLQHFSEEIVVVGRDKSKAYEEQKKKGSSFDVIILDDAHQSYHIIRDLNILMINAIDPFGYEESLIPRGSLREPLKEALSRTDLVVIHNSNLVSSKILNNIIKRLHDIPIVQSQTTPKSLFHIKNPQQLLPIESLLKKQLFAFSAIGCPESFHSLLKTLTTIPFEHQSFVDHHKFTDNELKSLQNKGSTLITTEKDYWRNPTALEKLDNCLVLCTELQITNGKSFLENKLSNLVTTKQMCK